MQVRGVLGAPRPDGRLVRGRLRRTELLTATLAVIERDGVAGVSHRAVAAQAGVSLASTTYHFASLDDLLVAALTWAAEDLTAELQERVNEMGARPADELARLIEHCLVYRRGRTLAEYELYLLAVRRPALREAAAAWLEPLTEIARNFTTDPHKASLLVAALDGILLQSLIGARPYNKDDFSALLTLLR
ncbi:TetR/AcrR family transcriptional regulator [Kribbella sp. VKM Ac-2568]|uniref:TetR/AcrR family transcriptional regulator n=1 Tax=Kribbella sp. VKM Ac-2568 TaxID=2512219 RepID=UPI0010D94E18|nr:TetR family transcriptional regulator [Kribbella sp. VKM Ac-2568]TCM51531.1 TetR family transcriptional regulator [Kribbella sp. VKM Ac-2568]